MKQSRWSVVKIYFKDSSSPKNAFQEEKNLKRKRACSKHCKTYLFMQIPKTLVYLFVRLVFSLITSFLFFSLVSNSHHLFAENKLSMNVKYLFSVSKRFNKWQNTETETMCIELIFLRNRSCANMLHDQSSTLHFPH